ncbi:ABC transporter family [Cryptosporidium sp. chipmunk genotype I]|uniref:ABC transporter family n=1 Tax=Cryptosporidium sp. chipmunk genotype I TaxID=1280935 RepID=UPI00351A0155|nr:ABC transporter family [Cryptosporidium sp. chipmunk genotype I]
MSRTTQNDTSFHKKIIFQKEESMGIPYSKDNPIKKQKNQSFLSFAYSYIQFTWVTKWIYLGSRKPLPAKDLPNLPETDSTNYWSNMFENSIEKERLKNLSSFDRKVLVIRALWRCLYGQFIILIILKVSWEVCLYVNNSVIRGFIQYKEMESSAEISGASSEKSQALGVGFRHGLLLVLFHAVHVYISTQFNFWESRVILKIQTCLKTSIFKRLIESKSCAKNLLQNGKEIVNSKIQEDELRISDDIHLDIDSGFSNQDFKSQNGDLYGTGQVTNRSLYGKKGLEDKYTVSTNVFNLLMVDVEDIEDFIMALIQFILLPCRIFVASLLMYKNIGESAIPGVVVMISMIVFMIVLDVVSALLKGPLLYWRDKRLAKLHEVLNKVRAIKILGWASFAEEIVLRDRRNEISYLYRIISFSALSYLFFKLAISGSVVAIMVYYTKGMLNKAGTISSTGSPHPDGFDLKASNIIPLIHVINYVAGILRTVPNSLNMLIEGWISLKRFSHHLEYSHIPSNTSERQLAENYNFSSSTNIHKSNVPNEEAVERQQKQEETPLISKILTFDGRNMLEVNETISKKNQDKLPLQVFNPDRDQQIMEYKFDESIIVYLQDLKYVSESEDDRSKKIENGFTLFVPKMIIRKNSCHLIVGNSGSGKSTLLYGILGEVYSKQGLRFIRPQGSTIGFCSEDPWIPIGTVRSVILFERPWNEKRYNRVVEACLLIEDFMQWQERDLRVLDDGGHILSGGQRSRLTLARALYGFLSDLEEYNRFEETYPTENSYYSLYCSNERDSSRFDTQLFLFDDIFVSLDPNVGRRIFFNLFNRENGILTGGEYSAVIVISTTVLLCFLDEKLSQEEINEKFGVEINIWNIKSESGGSNFNTLEHSEYDVLKKNVMKKDGNFRNIETGSEMKFDHSGASSRFAANEKFELRKRNLPAEKEVNFYNGLNSLTMMDCRNKNLTSKNKGTASYTSSDFYSEDIVCVQSSTGHRAIPLSLYRWYLSKVGIVFFISVCLLIMASIVLDNGQDFLLVEWTGFTSDGKDLKSDVEFYESSSSSINTLESHRNYMYGLIIIFIFGMLTHLLVQLTQIYASVRAAMKIHNEMLSKLLSTSQEFFDRNTIGQIINRFCLDMISIDRRTMFKICSFVSIVLEILIRGGFIIFVFPWLLLMIPPICLFAWFWLFQYYRHTSRELFRSNLSAHTPVCNIYTQALMGGTIIRAFKCGHVFLHRNINYIDDLQKIKFMRSGSAQWISVRMQLLMLPFTAGITLVPIVLKYMNLSTAFFASFSIIKITAGSWGLALVYAMSYAPLIDDSFNMFTCVEKSMCAVERISVLIDDLEDSKKKEFDEEVHESKYKNYMVSNHISPQNTFQGLYINELRVEYGNQSLGIELKNEYVNYGECIGVIGRTGSGKTTFLNSLLGLTPIQSSLIFLDGVWLFNKEMRQNKNDYIGVLPQNSIGFDGWTIRKFLDPFEEIHDDQLIWDGISACGLETTLRSLSGMNPLNTVLGNTSGDISKSRGFKDKNECKFTQKHLRQLALARLVIHRFKYKIVLVDEPPEELSGDLQNQNGNDNYNSMASSAGKLGNNVLDSQYLSVEEIVSKFMNHCIVFIVAHNYKSLKSCNRIWVLSGGLKVNECEFSQVNNQQMLADFLLSNSRN